MVEFILSLLLVLPAVSLAIGVFYSQWLSFKCSRSAFEQAHALLIGKKTLSLPFTSIVKEYDTHISLRLRCGVGKISEQIILRKLREEQWRL